MAGLTCRACGSGTVEVLDFVSMPLAGDFRPLGEKNLLYPLAVDVCRSCGLLQVRETVDPHVLFGPDYRYASSTVPSLVRHFESYARELGTTNGGLILDVGCNDGVLLGPLGRLGWRAVGIDASDNVAEMARRSGFDVTTGFFDRDSASVLLSEYGRFDVVTCSNVFAHNPDLQSFMDALDDVLKPDGQFWVEVQDATAIHRDLSWDQLYHEHCFYWTPHALLEFMRSRGYKLRSIIPTPMHGGAIRASFSRNPDQDSLEMFWPPYRLQPDDWSEFRSRAEHSRWTILDAVEALRLNFAYGAAGRAVTLINWSGISLDFVVDGSPLRHGMAIPNTVIPIISEDEFFGGQCPRSSWYRPWCLVTAHDKIADIRSKVLSRAPGRAWRFVKPLPEVRII